jgi:hypothetical protein
MVVTMVDLMVVHLVVPSVAAEVDPSVAVVHPVAVEHLVVFNKLICYNK